MARRRGGRPSRAECWVGESFFAAFATSILLTGYYTVPYGRVCGTYKYHLSKEDTMGVVSSKTSLASQHYTATEAGFHRSWYPLCLARDLAPGKVIGRDFLGTRVVAYRDPP